jgi:16S rRNA processing protein RimM
VVKTQGRRGEVALELHSGVPDRFVEGMRLWALGQDNTHRELQIEEIWPHKVGVVAKFAGIQSISEAEALVGCELQVPSTQRAQLEPGWDYISDLVGCAVVDAGREIGKVKDIRFGGGQAPLLVVANGPAEHEIPYAAAYLQDIDLARRQIRMVLPEGMLEVNAPMTEREKQEQRGTRK